MSRKRHPKANVQVPNHKFPSISTAVPTNKKPVIAEDVPLYDEQKAAWRISKIQLVDVPLYDEQKAAWRISKIQLVDPYGWHVLDANGLAQIKDTLSSLERNTWKDIFVRDARNNHRIETATLKCAIARKWMADNMPDQPYLWTIRVTGKERIWGVLAEGAYHVIFWDPEHLIWEVSKR